MGKRPSGRTDLGLNLMARDLFNRLYGKIDALRSYSPTRARSTSCGSSAPLSDGRPMPRRTFCNSRGRRKFFRLIEIKVDPATHEYYIAQGEHNDSMQRWLLNNAATHRLLTDSRDVAHKIMVDDVPSARGVSCPGHRGPPWQPACDVRLHALLPSCTLRPTFCSNRITVKLFRQRWYLVGRHVAQNRIKTYALDRISKFRLLTDTFEPGPDSTASAISPGAFGIVADEGGWQRVVLRVQPGQAKYFGALPLHASQEGVCARQLLRFPLSHPPHPRLLSRRFSATAPACK